MEKEEKKSSDFFKYGTIEYYSIRTVELENQRNKAKDESDYYRKELAKAHELLGRTVHQNSERWDSLNLTSYYPTDNKSNKRTIENPKGE